MKLLQRRWVVKLIVKIFVILDFTPGKIMPNLADNLPVFSGKVKIENLTNSFSGVKLSKCYYQVLEFKGEWRNGRRGGLKIHSS